MSTVELALHLGTRVGIVNQAGAHTLQPQLLLPTLGNTSRHPAGVCSQHHGNSKTPKQAQ
jgi:hypothetical protein